MAAKQDKKKAVSTSETASQKRGLRKTREGVVVSDKMDKTVVVSITRLLKHAAYKKYIRKTMKYLAHDKDEQCSVGDRVRIVETNPISKNKRWKVQEILSKAV